MKLLDAVDDKVHAMASHTLGRAVDQGVAYAVKVAVRSYLVDEVRASVDRVFGDEAIEMAVEDEVSRL